jgi:hypothetical protein
LTKVSCSAPNIPKKGYTLLRLCPEVLRAKRIPALSYDGLTTVVGNGPELSPGERVRLQGLWDAHPKHVNQIRRNVSEPSRK